MLPCCPDHVALSHVCKCWECSDCSSSVPFACFFENNFCKSCSLPFRQGSGERQVKNKQKRSWGVGKQKNASLVSLLILGKNYN